MAPRGATTTTTTRMTKMTMMTTTTARRPGRGRRRSRRHPLPLACLAALPLMLLLLLLVGSSAAAAAVAVAVAAADDGDGGGREDPASDDRASSGEGGDKSSSSDDDPSLSSSSVVLVTGAAGFLGSELALALLRTYDVRKLLLVDDMGIPSGSEKAYVPPPGGGFPWGSTLGDQGSPYECLAEEEMGGFEMRRQRAFRVFHELTSGMRGDRRGGGEGGEGGGDDDAETVRFYRADMRPSIPEFFDFGEVPLLEGIFQSHPDITHVVHLADVPLHAQNQAIPRSRDSVKTGRMEGLLEEMRLMIERASGNGDGDGDAVVRLPQLVYASSHEVYDRISSSASHLPQASSSSGNAEKKRREQEDAKKSNQPNPPPFREDLPITTPSSLHGTSKLIDEVLASAYHSTHGIYSVGLRFFDVYGPWNAPGSVVFDLAERVLALNSVNNAGGGNGNGAGEDDHAAGGALDPDRDGDVADYVYVDDAVDAILAAMQYRPPPDASSGGPPPPVVFNVGTGRGTSMRELKAEMSRHFPKALPSGGGGAAPSNEKTKGGKRLPTKSVASIALSGSLLGYRPRVSLEEGLAHTLAWHRDRAYPYGKNPHLEESFEVRGVEGKIVKSLSASRRRGREEAGEDGGECSPLDRECLRDALAFPCASECRCLDRCTPSVWDDVSALSRVVTTGCDAVLYTVLLDEDAEQIPSAISATTSAEDYLPFVGAGLPEDVGRRTQARCNIAFVSSGSPLVDRLKSEGEEYLDENVDDAAGVGVGGGVLPPLLRHGFWTVLPVPTSDTNSSWLHAFDGTFALEYLPKVSPGRFFGPSVRYAVYAAPNVLVKNLSNVLKRMEGGPPVPPASPEGGSSTPPNGGGGSTALMVALKRPSCDPAQRGAPCIDTYERPPTNDAIQSRAYNMIRMALRGDLLGGGLEPVLDSSLVVHSLREEDSRLFRCDVYGETAQWGARSDEGALEFIASLHDLWSRAFVHWTTGARPWWIDAAEGGGGTASEGGSEKEEGGRQQHQQPGQRGKWMGVLSQTEARLFAHLIPSDDLGVVDLE